MKILLIVVLSVMTVAALALGSIYYISQKTITDKGGMVNNMANVVDECRYSLGGGMDGDSVSITVKANDNETATLEVVSCSSPDYEEITESYTVSFDSLEKIYQLYTKYDVKNWGKLPESELIALDAPVTSISIKTVNTTVSFDSDKEFPGDGYSIILDIRSVLYDCIEQARSSEQPGSAE